MKEFLFGRFRVLGQRTLWNLFGSILQVVIISLAYFVLYKVILKSVGPEKLGLWSIIVSATSVANMGNLGVNGSIVNLIAVSDARKEKKRINSLIWTSLVTVLVLICVISLILYSLSFYFLPLFLSQNVLAEAFNLLPFTFLSLIINSLNGTFLAALDGFELIYVRSLIVCSSTILLLGSSIYLVNRFGLLGLAFSQLVQSLFILSSSIFLLRKFRVPDLLLNYFISRKTFKEVVAYGLNFQMISIMSLLFDPITKFFLSSFSGLSSVAYFEIASKLVVQIRSMILSASQALVPSIAKSNALNLLDIRSYFLQLNEVISGLSFYILNVIAVTSPYISLFFMGNFEQEFIIYLIILSGGWLINLFSLAAYIVNIGIGRLKYNVISHALVGVFNIVFCFAFKRWNGYGVIVAFFLALSSASIYLLVSFKKNNNIKIKELFFPAGTFSMFLLGLFPILVLIVNAFYSYEIPVGYVFLFFLLYVVLIFNSLRKHVIIRRLKLIAGIK